MAEKIRLALLISGSGTTACSIISAYFTGKLKLTPVLVIASNSGISGIKRLIDIGFDKRNIVVADPRIYQKSSVFARKLLTECEKRNVNLVGQYGWLPLTPKEFIDRFTGRIINQHPGPLDPPRMDFGGKGMYGRRVHCTVLYFRRKTNHDYWTEAVTHFVTKEYDKGEVIKSKKIPILSSDSVEDLQSRVLPIEHQVQIAALEDFIKGKVKIYCRDNPLIKKNEYHILKEAQRTALLLYPHG